RQRISDPETLKVLRNEGKVLRFQMLRVAFKCNNQTHPRLGITISKRWVKRAVDRNAMRRWIRESFRQQQAQLGAVDILVNLHANVANKEGEATQHALRRVLDEAWVKLRRFASRSGTSA